MTPRCGQSVAWLLPTTPLEIPNPHALHAQFVLVHAQELAVADRVYPVDENSGVDGFIAANIAAQVATVCEIPLTLVLLAIVKRIYRMQVEHHRGSSSRHGTGSDWDRRESEPTSGEES